MTAVLWRRESKVVVGLGRLYGRGRRRRRRELSCVTAARNGEKVWENLGKGRELRRRRRESDDDSSWFSCHVVCVIFLNLIFG